MRRSSFIASPWKNGGGVTHEVMRVPQNAAAYRWRVSVAHIDSSGPFSDFAGYNRNMVLLRGRGLSLQLGQAATSRLQRIGELLSFDGGMPAFCELLDGPCVDLNLMVLKSAAVDARVEQLLGSQTLRAANAESVLIFGIDAPLSVSDDAGQTTHLEAWDLAVLRDGGARVEALPIGDISAPRAVFFASITD